MSLFNIHQIVEKLQELYEQPTFLHPESMISKRPWIFIGTWQIVSILQNLIWYNNQLITGTPGPGANIHIDTVDLSSWQAQISGTKSWLLRPPPECWWSCHGDMEVTINPGDIIVVNTNMWYHSTKIEGDQISLVITNEFD